MNLVELQRSLNSLRLGGIALSLETRLLQAQTEKMSYLDLHLGADCRRADPPQ